MRQQDREQMVKAIGRRLDQISTEAHKLARERGILRDIRTQVAMGVISTEEAGIRLFEQNISLAEDKLAPEPIAVGGWER